MPVSRRTGSISKVEGVGQPRQQPGSACEECRKRKLRCEITHPLALIHLSPGADDHVQATDSDLNVAPAQMPVSCVKSIKTASLEVRRRVTLRHFGVALVRFRMSFSEYLASWLTPQLTPQTVALERRLSIDQTADHQIFADPDNLTLDEFAHHRSASDGEMPRFPSPEERKLTWDSEIHVHMPPTTPTVACLPLPPFKFPPSPPTPVKSTQIDDLMRADLYDIRCPVFCQS